MRSIRFIVAALALVVANQASAVFVPYETVGGASGYTTALDPAGAGVPRGNNNVDVSPTGACSFTIVAGNVSMDGCRDRTGAACPTGEPCDLDRVPAGRCVLGANAACLWPNGAGFCTDDANVGCLVTADCTSHGLVGPCDTTPCPGGDCSGCACQGTDDSLATFETNAARCGGSTGICSDGDGEFSYAPSMSGGLCAYINVSGSNPTNCGREAGQEWTGLRSGFGNPQLTPTTQREPGLGATAGPIVDLAVTQVYDIGAPEAGRGGIRRFSVMADSYWQDPPWADKTLTGGGASSHIWTLWCDTPGSWSTDDLLPNGQTCWNSGKNSIGYVWTANIPAGDYLPSGSTTTNLDVDMNGVADCPPHCGLNYDMNTLEQLAIEAVLRLDVRAGAQLGFDMLVPSAAGGTTPGTDVAGARDLISVASIVSNVWLPAIDQRCWMGGDPEVVCSASCTGGFCSGYPTLSCTTVRDCQLYVGRCSDSEQPCNPDGSGTPCPGAQICRTCVGNYAAGVCVGIGGACRVDSDCANNNCGDSAGNALYPEVMAANPLAIPVGYNTYGFAELELETKCSPTRPGRLGLVTATPRSLAVPLAIIYTTGKAASEIIDPDLGGNVNLQDNARLGLVRGTCISGPARCSVNADCILLGQGSTCVDAPVVGIANAAGSAPLDGGSYAVGRVFPVDPSGPACCTATGNVTNTWDKSSEVIRPVITANAGAITWLQGNDSAVDFTAGSGTAGPAPIRGNGWGSGADGTPGCPGDSSNVDPLGALPDAGPCNDPLGVVAQPLCTGSDCEGNTGADDVPTTATINGVAGIRSLNARYKVPDPTASGTSAPTFYSVANLSGADLDALLASDTDFQAAVEGMTCPMIGDCSQAGVQDCIADSDCGVGNTCLNRVRRCENPNPADADMDGVPDASDNCPSVANPTQTNSDGDPLGDACDNCPVNTNAGQENFDADPQGDACDLCPTVVNATNGNTICTGLNAPLPCCTGAGAGSCTVDADGDGINNACDNCPASSNTGVAIGGALLSNRAYTGARQLDDDIDGRGNICDFDYNNAGLTITTTDFNDMKGAQGKSLTLSTCGAVAPGGSGNTQRCYEFDHFPTASTAARELTVSGNDFNTMKANQGKAMSLFPRCPGTACTSPFSRPIAPGPATLGKVVCETGGGTAPACTY